MRNEDRESVERPEFCDAFIQCGHCIPLRRRAAGLRDRGVGHAVGNIPREVRVGLDDEADERSHRDAAVLDFRVAKEADCRLRAVRGAQRGLAE